MKLNLKGLLLCDSLQVKGPARGLVTGCAVSGDGTSVEPRLSSNSCGTPLRGTNIPASSGNYGCTV